MMGRFLREREGGTGIQDKDEACCLGIEGGVAIIISPKTVHAFGVNQESGLYHIYLDFLSSSVKF